MNLKLWSNPKYTPNNESVPVEWNFNPGVTMLLGSNGSGKTTTLQQIDSVFNGTGRWDSIKDNNLIKDKYDCYFYDSTKEISYMKDTWLENNELHELAKSYNESEGQFLYHTLTYHITKIGKAVSVAKGRYTRKQGILLLFDSLDSGLSIDIIYKLKKELFDFIVEQETESNFNVYIICSANTYELCKGYQCVDVVTRTNIQGYRTYNDFAKTWA